MVRTPEFWRSKSWSMVSTKVLASLPKSRWAKATTSSWTSLRSSVPMMLANQPSADTNASTAAGSESRIQNVTPAARSPSPP